MSTGSATASMAVGTKTIQKLRFRILPFVLLLFVVALIDRNNVSFAALTMNKELGITSQQFGLIFGIFYFGYFIFEIPSNLLLHKVGARVWIARILISWGIVATLSGVVHTAHQLYIVRFLLGLAEAGYFPGIVLYLTYWFPRREQARAFALLIMATPVTIIVGAPISGLILDHVHWLGFSSWRWLLILEGLPAIVLGGLTYFLLPSRPDEVQFLTPHEKEWIKAELSREEQQKLGEGHYSVLQVLASRRVWHLVLVYFGMMVGLHTFTSWAPQLVKSLSSMYSNSVIGLLLIMPSVTGLAAMICVSHSSDRRLERRYHVALPALAAAVALCLLRTASSPLLSMALLCLLAAGVYSYAAPFWALPNEFLTGYSAAAGIALINSVGNLGGLLGPAVVGFFAQRFGKVTEGLAFISVPLLLAAVLVLLLPPRRVISHMNTG
jgi:ACS family tartrate transporter-like MFS transporter